ncbi:MAG TPA: amidohydrolase family protein [Chloroflexota bacterium]|nr:amidohydrolase family protein [Chloroflexota bacterium]
MSSLKIDVFPHIFPKPVFKRLGELKPAFANGPIVAGRESLYELDARFRLMDRYDNYVQVLTLSGPSLEDFAEGQAAGDLAALANDSMAELCQKYPDRFLGFAASVALDDVDGALTEVDRAVKQLGALGIQIFTNVRGHPMDESRFEPLFAKLAELNRVVWIHPARNADHPDYPSEKESKYGLFFKLGWPYETSVCISRLIFSGIVERYPHLRFLTHHAGGIVPHLAGRLGLRHDSPGQRRGIGVDERFTPEYTTELYQRFYGDTVFSGADGPLECAIDFFGLDHILFGTDMPYGAEAGELFVRETIADLEQLDVTEAQRDALFEANARTLLGLPA